MILEKEDVPVDLAVLIAYNGKLCFEYFYTSETKIFWWLGANF